MPGTLFAWVRLWTQLSVWVSEGVNVFFLSFSWILSLSLPPYSSWLLFKHESLIKCDGLWQWCNPAICSTANTHTRDGLSMAFMCSTWCLVHRELENTLWLLSEKQTQTATERWKYLCEYATLKRKAGELEKTAVRLPLHRWNNIFEKYRIIVYADEILLAVAQYSAKNANDCDKNVVFICGPPIRRQIFSIFGEAKTCRNARQQ